jgi:RNA polymerase sigma factor (sigma-70 family)
VSTPVQGVAGSHARLRDDSAEMPPPDALASDEPFEDDEESLELTEAVADVAQASRLSESLDDAALGALIARIGEHDDKALAALYDATSARVFGLVGRIVNDTALAEEVVEDTYWQVWRQAVRFEAARGRPLTWLLAMARSRAIDALRRRDRRSLVPLEEDELAALCDEDGAAPPDLLAAARGQHLLQRALAALDAQPRQLIALAFFRGLTHEEIAACTGLPLGTVKSQIRRSLQALKQWLTEAGCPDLPL